MMNNQTSRSYKMLQMIEDQARLRTLNLPSYESTRGTDKYEQIEAVNAMKMHELKNMREPICQNKTFEDNDSEPMPYQDNGSEDEYVPSASNASSITTDESDLDEIENLSPIKSVGKEDDTVKKRKIVLNNSTYKEIQTSMNHKGGIPSVFNIEKEMEMHELKNMCEPIYQNKTFEDSDSEPMPYQDNGSEDEYVPSASNASSTTTDESDLDEIENLTPIKSAGKEDETVKKREIVLNNSTYKEIQTSINQKGFPSLNDIEKVQKTKIVPTSTANSHTKSFFCIFCRKLVKRFGRHILSTHKKEPKIADILRYPANHLERKKLICAVRNEGTFLYNNNENVNTGDLIVSRRPNVSKPRIVKDYTPCPNCQAYFVSDNLYRHYQRCSNAKSNRKSNVKKQSVQLQIQLDCKRLNLNPGVTLLLQKMKNDHISQTIRNDQLLLRMAGFFTIKYRAEKHLNNHARQKLRQLTRLFLAIKQDNPDIIDFKECLQPKYFDNIIFGVQKVCKLDNETGTYKLPSMANHLGIYLRECVNVLHSLCIIEENNKRKLMVEDFKNLLIYQYGTYISRAALKTVEESKWNKEAVLPITSDITLFRDHLVNQAENCCSHLNNEGFSYIEWKLLVEISAALILTFNRKRPGETQRIYLTNYVAKQSIKKESDEYKTLTTLERMLCDSFKRVEFRGKRGRKVPILLRKNHIKYIDTFLKYRSEAGVSEENVYLFGIDDNKHIRLTDIIRRESVRCNAERPELLRATKLRKQVATTSQLLDLNENEMQMLADFMGHDIEIHKSHYRTPELTLQLAKMSKLLIAVDSGELRDYKNKNFENIDITKFLNDEHDISLNDLNSESGSEDDVEIASTSNNNNNLLPGSSSATITKSNSQSSKHNSEDENFESDTEDLPLSTFQNYTESTPTKSKQSLSRRRLFLSNSPQKIIVSKSSSVTVKRVGAGQNQTTRTTTKSKNIKIRRIPWVTPEKSVVRNLFKSYLNTFTLPSEKEVVTKTKNVPVLRRRTPAQIKAWVNNENKRKLRDSENI